MRIAICDDDAKMWGPLEDCIKSWSASREIKVDISCYSHGDAFVFALPDYLFELVFLDIQMGEGRMSGIDLAKHIRKTNKNILIVFVTSFENYVLDGFDVNALHYIIKPAKPDKLFPVLDKALIICQSREKTAMTVSDKNGHSDEKIKLSFDDIYHIKMCSHTALIHTKDKIYELRITAKELDALLPKYFLRCHRSYIVNLFKAERLCKSSLILINDERLAVSRNNFKSLKEAFVKIHNV